MATESPSESQAATVQLDGEAQVRVRTGNVSVSAVKVGEVKGDKALNEQLGRRLKMAVFIFAGTFVASLLCLFWRYCIGFMHGAEKMAHKGQAINFDWHIILLAALMIVPATAVVLVLARSIFVGTAVKDDDAALPSVAVVREVAEAIKAVTTK